MKAFTYQPPTRIAHLKKKAFLRTFGKLLGSVRRTCSAVGISYKTYYNWLHEDQEFAEAAADCRQQLIEWLAETAVQRATGGKRPSDLLLMFTLKKLDPSYRERHEVIVTDERVKAEAHRLVEWVRQQAAEKTHDVSTNGQPT